MKINKKVEYALMALKFMAERNDGQLTTAREICDKFSTPFDTVSKVMQKLNSVGVLNSVKGTKGGYELTKDLGNVSYIEIENLIEGKNAESVCKGKSGLCDLHSTCNIVGPVERLNFQINHFLSSLTLEELLLNNTGDIRE